MNQIQFCIMMITALGVGFITPPLGLNLFVVSGITGESILKIAYRAIPFVFFMLIVTLLIAYVPRDSHDLARISKKQTLTSTSDAGSVTETVQGILSEIEAGGEEAAKRFAEKFDRYTGNIVVTPEEIEEASNNLSQKLKR
jgi:hypothetical protein